MRIFRVVLLAALMAPGLGFAGNLETFVECRPNYTARADVLDISPSYSAERARAGANQSIIPAEEIGQAEWATCEATAIKEKLRAEKIAEIIADGLSRVQAYLPGVKDWDTLELVKELWLSIAPAARQATANFQAAIDIYQYGLDKVVWANTASEQDIAAYDSEADNGWP